MEPEDSRIADCDSGVNSSAVKNNKMSCIAIQVEKVKDFNKNIILINKKLQESAKTGAVRTKSEDRNNQEVTLNTSDSQIQ